MRPLLTKKEILDWYKTAIEILNLRRQGRHPRGRLTESDYQAYSRSVEDFFKRCKQGFNQRLKEAAAKNANTNEDAKN